MTTALKKLFGANLKAFRKKNGMTQAALAEAVDKSIDLISQIERGTSSPSFETISKLSEALDVSAQDFFNGSGLNVKSNSSKFASLQNKMAKLSEDDLDWVGNILEAILDK